jgi:Resolvase, N terminal domain
VGKAISVERWSYTPIVPNSCQTNRPSFWSSIFWFSNLFSFSEQHFRMTGPVGELMLAIAARIAKQERIRISDRTRAGLARTRRRGKVPGRPSGRFVAMR